MTQYPAPTNLELVLTSRVSIEQQNATEGCTLAAWSSDCKYTPQAPGEITSFIRNFENFTLRIRHGVRGQHSNKEGASTGESSLSGELVGLSGNVIRTW